MNRDATKLPEVPENEAARWRRKAARRAFGRPGNGRKTQYRDRRREANRKACRGRREDES